MMQQLMNECIDMYLIILIQSIDGNYNYIVEVGQLCIHDQTIQYQVQIHIQ